MAVFWFVTLINQRAEKHLQDTRDQKRKGAKVKIESIWIFGSYIIKIGGGEQFSSHIILKLSLQSKALTSCVLVLFNSLITPSQRLTVCRDEASPAWSAGICW